MNDSADASFTWSTLAAAIRSVGQPGFAGDCLQFLNCLIKIDHIALFGFDSALRPLMLGGASPVDNNIAVPTGQQYIQSFYMCDPNIRYINSHRFHPQRPLMLRLKAKEITDREYRRQIYEQKGLLDRVSWIGLTSNCWYCANLYRDKKSGYFNHEDLQRLQQIGDTLCALLEQHIARGAPPVAKVRTSAYIEYFERLVAELWGELAPREISVCARALSGMTRNGIGLDLGIKRSTVATLLQRAYAKLNISSLNELFALCLQALALPNDQVGSP